MTENETAPVGKHRGGETDASRRSVQSDDSADRAFMHRWRSCVFNSALKSGTRLALLALAEFADERGEKCFPGMETLSKLCGSNEKAVRANLVIASRGGWFVRSERRSGKGWRRYEYTLTIPDGADTRRPTAVHGADKTTAPSSPYRADELPAPNGASCGDFRQMVRAFSPNGAGKTSDDLAHDLASITRKRFATTSATARDQTASCGGGVNGQGKGKAEPRTPEQRLADHLAWLDQAVKEDRMTPAERDASAAEWTAKLTEHEARALDPGAAP